MSVEKSHQHQKNFIPSLSGLLILALVSSGCQMIPRGATTVQAFDVKKYVGTWYEIARIDSIFEKDLNNVTARYTLLKNGEVEVLNRGYNTKKLKWQASKGKARFRGSKNVGELEVSFFGPFFSGYNILALQGDQSNYEYALVAGKDTDYLWILSRTKSIPQEIKEKFLERAKEVGYNVHRLNWIEHTNP